MRMMMMMIFVNGVVVEEEKEGVSYISNDYMHIV
jgi:hypothetical protein